MKFIIFLNFRCFSSEDDSLQPFDLSFLLSNLTSINPEEFIEGFTEDFPEDFTSTPSVDLDEIKKIEPILPPELPPWSDPFYEFDEDWSDYYDNEIEFTYFDDYKDISNIIHRHILELNEGIEVFNRAGNNETLEVNFQLFIKDVTNLKQEGFECM